MDESRPVTAIPTETEDGLAAIVPRDVASAAGLVAGRRVTIAAEQAGHTPDGHPIDEAALARIRALLDEIDSWPRTGLVADKAFFDELSGDI
jgi:antitoxin VapB